MKYLIEKDKSFESQRLTSVFYTNNKYKTKGFFFKRYPYQFKVILNFKVQSLIDKKSNIITFWKIRNVNTKTQSCIPTHTHIYTFDEECPT